MPKFTGSRPTYPLDSDLMEDVKTVLRSRPTGAQNPAYSSTELESELKKQGVTVKRGADLKTVLERLRNDGLIEADFRRIGNWYVEWVDPNI
jgi:hypothetical protein